MSKRFQMLFEELKTNKINHIIYYEAGIKIVKSFCELSDEIDTYIRRIYALINDGHKTVAIIGPTSYQWMVIDLACLKGGFKSIAIPEGLSEAEIKSLVKEIDISLFLIDHSLKSKFIFEGQNTKYYRAPGNITDSFECVVTNEKNDWKINILKHYSIAFSSGTSENIKRINLQFPDPPASQKKKRYISVIKQYVNYKLSFWSSKKNRIIIFMPFSHVQQRAFVFEALLRKINIIISDSNNCLRHIITDKPNIMVSVPIFYEALAREIERKVRKFTGFQKILFNIFNNLGINDYVNNNPVKRLFSYVLFKDIRKIYGGKGDYFITGSAPIDIEALKIFYSIGVKIFQGYGQSETDIIAINTEKNFKIGSVGKPSVTVKIDADGEILIKREKRHEQNAHLHNVDDEGYIHTGDLGYIDSEGYLFLLGRKDDVIVLASGKKIFPSEIEKKIQKEILCSVIVMHLNKEDKIGVVIEKKAEKPLSEDSIAYIINSINQNLEKHSQIVAYLIADEQFEVENGLVTTNLKIKRKAIQRKYMNATFNYLN